MHYFLPLATLTLHSNCPKIKNFDALSPDLFTFFMPTVIVSMELFFYDALFPMVIVSMMLFPYIMLLGRLK